MLQFVIEIKGSISRFEGCRKEDSAMLRCLTVEHVPQTAEEALASKTARKPIDRIASISESTIPVANLHESCLAIIEDKGKVLGDRQLERRVIEFCDKYQNEKISKIKNRERVLKQAKDFAIQYSAKVAVADSNISGTITKYRIRQGGLFLIVKKLIKKVEKRSWRDWFAESYGKSELRSVQDYMKLARVPNVLRYAVFGRQRLLAIVRIFKKKDSDDLVGDFLKENGIQFKPDEKTNLNDLKFNTDVAILYTRLKNCGLEQVAKAKVEEFVTKGYSIYGRHLSELKLLKERGEDLNAYLDSVIGNNGVPITIQTRARKSQSLKKLADEFGMKIQIALNDTEYLGSIDRKTVVSLRQLLEQLEDILNLFAYTRNQIGV